MPTKLLLIRHAQTDWNQKQRYSGFINVKLNRNGKEQAEKLRKRLEKEKFQAIYSSDRRRALETARIIFKNKKIKKIPELREIHFGIFEGLTCAEIMTKYPGIYKEWLRDPFLTRIPNAENLNDFRERVKNALKNIVIKNKNETVAVVCHGGTISVLLNNILKSRKFWKYIPDSASISIIEYRNNKPKIMLFNDTSHLS